MSQTSSESAKKKLLDAAVEGDLEMMRTLLVEDARILDRVSYEKRPPIHVAAMKGHLSLVKQMLSCNPQLAEELDAHQLSPLHVAASNGHLEVVKELLGAAPEMCLSQDCYGRNPVHVAAVKGRVEVLKELVEKHPIAAREKTDGGLTLLHLCLKYQHLDARTMIELMESNLCDLLHCKDHDGNNVLHMAARYGHAKIVDHLVKKRKVDLQAMNLQGQTARMILKQTSPSYDPKILALLNPKACKEQWMTEQRDTIMVVAILIATMAFQVGVNPPGGVFENEMTDQHNHITYCRGEAVMAFTKPKAYKAFIYVNTASFVMSLSAILLLISGLPFKKKIFMWMLLVTMWLTITVTAATYTISIAVVTPSHAHRRSLIKVIVIGVISWSCLMLVLFGGNTVRLANRWIQRKKGITIVEFVSPSMHKKGSKQHALGEEA